MQEFSESDENRETMLESKEDEEVKKVDGDEIANKSTLLEDLEMRYVLGLQLNLSVTTDIYKKIMGVNDFTEMSTKNDNMNFLKKELGGVAYILCGFLNKSIFIILCKHNIF